MTIGLGAGILATSPFKVLKSLALKIRGEVIEDEDAVTALF